MLTSCCGIRLKTAGVIIGCLGVAGAFVGIISEIVAAVKAEKRSADLNYAELSYYNINASYTDFEQNDRESVASIIAFIVFAVINLLASVLLILGTVKNRHLLLLPWLVISGIGIVIIGISLVLMVIGLFVVLSAGVSGAGWAFLIFFFFGLLMALSLYSYVVIFSLYKQIQSENSSMQAPIIYNPITVNYPTSVGFHPSVNYPASVGHSSSVGYPAYNKP